MRNFVWMVAGLTVTVLGASPSWAQAVPVPSLWNGHFEGQVGSATFSMPVSIEFSRPLPYEENPFHVFIGIGQTGQVGSASLVSAQQFSTSSGYVTLQYFSVLTQGSRIAARLIDIHNSEAAVINIFTAPNLSAQYAPPVMRGIYGSLGTSEMFYMKAGANFVIQRNGNQLSGEVQGMGASLAGIFPLPDIGYQGRFIASRVR